MLELSEYEAENFLARVTKSEQHAYIKIKTLHDSTVPVTHTLLKDVCRNATLDRCTVQQWHKCFREVRVSTKDNLWSGHSSTVINNTSVAIVTTVLDEYHCITLREIETETEIL